MYKQFERYLQMTLLALDLFILNIQFFMAQLLLKQGIPASHVNNYLQLVLVCNALWLLLSFFLRTYSGKNILIFESFTRRSLKVYLVWLILILFFLFFTRQINLSRIFIVTTLLGFGAGLLFNRFLYLGIRNFYKTKNIFTNRILIIGFNETGKKLAAYLQEKGVPVKIIGFITDRTDIKELSPYPVLRGINKSVSYAKELKADEIYSTISPEQDNEIFKIMEQSEEECIRFKFVHNLSLFLNKPIYIDYLKDLPIISLRNQSLDDIGNRIKKRTLDLLVSSFVIVFILSWLIPLIGLLIKLESRGPIFFSQLRTGKNKKEFECLKFRSMRKNKDSDQKQATKNDSRVTRIGKLLRTTSLDEFPQFINVFKGEMSLVGPRPHMLKHTDDYSKIVDEYMVRQFLKPGITGWAQVKGFRGEITKHEHIEMRVSHDLWYLQNWTLMLDIKIIFLTVYQVFKGDENAY